MTRARFRPTQSPEGGGAQDPALQPRSRCPPRETTPPCRFLNVHPQFQGHVGTQGSELLLGCQLDMVQRSSSGCQKDWGFPGVIISGFGLFPDGVWWQGLDLADGLGSGAGSSQMHTGTLRLSGPLSPHM